MNTNRLAQSVSLLLHRIEPELLGYKGVYIKLIASLLRDPDVKDRTPRVRVEYATTRAEDLKAVATIATFLAAVQAQTLAFSVDTPTTSLLRASNALAFAGITLDVLSALLALTAAQRLLRFRQLVDDVRDYLSRCETEELEKAVEMMSQVLARRPRVSAIQKYIRADLHKLVSKRLDSLSFSPKEEPAEVRTLCKCSHLRRTDAAGFHSLDTDRLAEGVARLVVKAGHMDFYNIAGDSAMTLVQYGVICFLASIFCFLWATQPVTVRISTLAISLGSLVLVPMMYSILSAVAVHRDVLR